MAAMSQGSLHRCSNIGRFRLISISGLTLLFVASCLALSPTSIAQQQQPQSDTPSSQAPAYTLHSSTRIVLTDVTVKDRAGHVVHGLPASAFHIFDNNQPQTITTFEEQNAAATAIDTAPASDPGTYSNDYLVHLPPVLNIVVLDTTGLSFVQQAYLAYQFNRFLKTLPSDLPLALYARVGETTVLLQNFTSDHERLLNASQKVMPRLAPLGRDPLGINDLNLLRQVSIELAQIPGRKNVLWFSGGQIPLSLDPTTYAADPVALREVYDLLEKARISIYPIDARGLADVRGVSARFVTLQHLQMSEIANGTGGQAFYNRNDLDKITDNILATDNSYYTLVFSPANFTADNKWHQVKVTVEGSRYQLSYRRGYYADGFNLEAPKDNKPRTLLLGDAKTMDLPADLRSSPIIFQASVVPAGTPEPGEHFFPLNDNVSHEKGTKTYTIRYSLPADVFATHAVNGRENASFEVAVLAFNQLGEKVGEKADHVAVKFPQSDSHVPVDIAQNIDLRNGDLYLYIAVWDTTTGRAGTLQIPFTAR